MPSPYRELLAVPGARPFVAAGLVGRMSMAVMGIGIVLLVSAVTGSYGIAGAVAATHSLCYAAGSPLTARLADRLGQRRVLVPVATGNAAAVALFVLSAELGLPVWTLFPAAAAAGVTQLSLGAWVRARWAHLLRAAPERLHTAFSFESVADETIFVAGPVAVTALATGVHPAAGLAVPALCTLGGGLALAAQRGSEPPPQPRAPGTRGRTLFADPAVLMIAPVFLMMGLVFGAIDVSAVAFADEQGHKGLAGALLGCYAFGSGAAALWYGARRWRAPLGRRFRIGLVALTAAMLPPLLVGDMWLMMAVVLCSGLAISPTAIPAYGLVERLVPAQRLTEGFAVVTTTVNLGAALGAALGGRLVDGHGSRGAFLVPLCAAAAAAAFGLAGARPMSKRELSSQPIAE